MSAILRIQLSYITASAVEVRVEESARGESRQVIEAPLTGSAIQALQKFLEAGDVRFCSLTDTEMAALDSAGVFQQQRSLSTAMLHRRIGEKLFDFLFPASTEPDHDVRGAFTATLTQAEQQRNAMTLQLRFDRDAVDLASLPWELLAFNGEQLVASGRIQLTRYVTFAQATTPFPVTDRLEVLTVTARPHDALTLDSSAETNAIEAAFAELGQRGLAHIHPLSPATPDALVAAINARVYHIIHFDGHGSFGRRCPYCGRYHPEDTTFCTTPRCGARLDQANLEGCLLFESNAGDGRSQLVSSHELATILTNRQVRLFLASACQSGAVKGASVFSSIGPRLLLAGVPAVVAMQFSVPVESTVAFSEAFYASLARGDSVAAATGAGRKMLISRGTWHVPALYLRSRDHEGQLFRFRDRQRSATELISGANGVTVYYRPAGSQDPDWAALRPRDALPYKFLAPYAATDSAVFFGRDSEIRELVGEVLQRSLTVLQGPAGVGKTSLVNAGLVPKLLGNGYLVFTIAEYDDLPGAMVRAAGQLAATDPNGAAIHSLQELVSHLVQVVGHPILFVFDHYEDFLRDASSERREVILQQLAQCVGTTFGLPVHFLIVVREDFVGRLTTRDGGSSGLWTPPVGLGLLTRSEAQAAIERPLERCDPPMSYDTAFLSDQLLRDLSAEANGEFVNPSHLQIVCHELYLTAIQQSTRVISSRQYPPGGTGAILARYLDQSLNRRFPDPIMRDRVRGLLKLMVSAAGERVSIGSGEAAQSLEVEPDQVRSIFESLRADGLVDAHLSSAQETSYSLSHHMLAQEVQRWFDREEVLNHCTQETLNRAWDDWYTQRFAVMQAPLAVAGVPGTPELLVGGNRLAEIRWRRDKIAISCPQLCLLLRSAVRHQCDPAFWAHQIAADQQAREMLAAINQGVPELSNQASGIALVVAALGLDASGAGSLPRAATGAGDSSVRHSAGLALAALGLDAIQAGLAAMADAAPAQQSWRRAQALAQMKAASFALPQTPLTLQFLVAVWSIGLRIQANRWQITAESLTAGLGAGVGLGLALFINVFLAFGVSWYALMLRSLILTPAGIAVGAFTILGTWIVRLATSSESGRSRALSQVVGLWLGFVTGLLVVWYPMDKLTSILIGSIPAETEVVGGFTLITQYVISGSLWGLSMAIGTQLLANLRLGKVWLRQMLGAGAGSAIGCLLARLLIDVVPLVEPSGNLANVEVVLAGFGFGAGLAGGRAAGAWLWRRLKLGSSELAPPETDVST